MEKFKEKIESLLKSRRFWGVVASIAVMAIVAFAYFYPDDIDGRVLQQHDMRQGMANGHETQLYQESSGEASRWTNSLFGGMPTFQISPSYPSNSLFDWINTVMGLGLPAPANLLMMMMLGFFILLMAMKMRWYVALIGAIGYGLSSYFVIIIGAGHLWKFITLAYIPPTIAGIVLCYRGRYLTGGALAALFAMMQIASNHIQMTYYFMFVILGFVIACGIIDYRRKEMKRFGIATGVLAAAALLAVTANLPSLYNTYEYSKETIRGGHSELTSPEGAASSDGLDREYIYAYSYGRSETFTLLIPNVKGGATAKPVEGSIAPVTLSGLDDAQDLAPEDKFMLDYLPQYFGEPEGTNGPVYVGALIVALFLLGCVIVRGPMKWVLIALTLFSILLALGRNCQWLTDLMIDHMPLYSKFRTPESILVIAEFTMPLLAAMALQKIFSADLDGLWQKMRKPLAITFGITMAICALGFIAPSIFGDAVTEQDKATSYNIAAQMAAAGYPDDVIEMVSLDNPQVYSKVKELRLDMVSADSVRSFIIVALGFILLALYMRRKLKAGVVAAGVGLIVVGDLYMANKRYLDSDSFTEATVSDDDSFPLTAADRTILSDTTMHYRVMDMPRFFSADPSYHHKALGGYHAAKLTRYQDLIERQLAPYKSYYDRTGQLMPFNAVDMLNARYYIVTGPDGRTLEPIKNPNAMGNAWLIDRIRYVDTPDQEMDAIEGLDIAREAVADKKFAEILGQPAAKAPGDTIFLTTYAPNRLTYHVDTKAGGVAVMSEVYFPWGWKATIDGQPAEIGRVNYVLRAVKVPAGSHTVEMVFDPESLHTTTTAAYIAVILIYLALIAAVALPLAKGLRKKDGDEATMPK